MKCCINGENVIRLLCLSAKLLKFEIQKCGQILCAHKPYFLMPGHKYSTRQQIYLYSIYYANGIAISCRRLQCKFQPCRLKYA